MNGILESDEKIVPHDTFYVYDRHGNLSFILPPKVRANIDKPSLAELEGLCFQYRFDKRDRLIEKKKPGSEVEFIVYNNLDQPVLSQSGNLRKENFGKLNDEWLFAKYDAFGRIVYTGKILSSDSQKKMSNLLENAAYDYEIRIDSEIYIEGKELYYSERSEPKIIDELYTINYYDNYDYNPELNLPISVQGQMILRGNDAKGLVTGSFTRVLGTDY